MIHESMNLYVILMFSSELRLDYFFITSSAHHITGINVGLQCNLIHILDSQPQYSLGKKSFFMTKSQSQPVSGE